MTTERSELEQSLGAALQTLALTRRHRTMYCYCAVSRGFLAYLRTEFPEVLHPDQLCRQPHLLGWLRCLGEHLPPLANKTRSNLLICLRRLLQELAAAGFNLAPDLIRPEDFPPLPHYLPRPLSLQDDQRVQQELRTTDDWPANALLLTRATGMRIGECMDLTQDCLRQLGPDQWGLHVPLGKLHSERLLPADPDIRHLVDRLLTLRNATQLPACSQAFLLPRRGSRNVLYRTLLDACHQAAQRAGCSTAVTPHRLRHTYASEMVRLGVSLPVLMRLLGHRDIHMTLRYVQVTPEDLQRQFQAARHLASARYPLPLPLPPSSSAADLPGIRQALAATIHLLEMYRRQLPDPAIRHKLFRLRNRLAAVSFQLGQFLAPEK
jgi:site-specific recombinase XerD